MRRALLLLFLLFAIVAIACESYETPPRPVVEGLAGGILADARAPIVVDFGTPVDPATVRVRLAYNETDAEGNLVDEDDDEATQLRVILAYDPVEGDVGGGGAVDPDGRRVRLTPTSSLPVGPQLVLVVEAGLTSTSGRVLANRVRIPVTFQVKCTAGSATALRSGVYFFVLQIAEPLGLQLQIFAAVEVDPATGSISSQFTNADRKKDGTRCSPPCPDTDACRTLPGPPQCVAPSTPVSNFDEHPDYYPNYTPPTGYSFTVAGCGVDDGSGATAIVTAPSTLVVQSPAVTVEGLVITASFTSDGRASGSLQAERAYLGTNLLGAGKGTMTALLLTPEQTPADVPRPPARTRDGGTP